MVGQIRSKGMMFLRVSDFSNVCRTFFLTDDDDDVFEFMIYMLREMVDWRLNLREIGEKIEFGVKKWIVEVNIYRVKLKEFFFYHF